MIAGANSRAREFRGVPFAFPFRSFAVILRACLALLLAAFATLAPAQAQKEPEYEPTPFQDGKDVVWVPTPQVVVNKMLDLAKVTPADFVIDLGSGDGRTVITAARRGARALGIEYNPDLVALSQRNAARNGVADRAQFVKADLFETDFSQATVITMFLLPDINLKLRPKILALAPGTRIVSNSFTMGDWEADDSADLGSQADCTVSWCTALFWIVPAQFGGSYDTAHGKLELMQGFQKLTGTLDGKEISHGRVMGTELSFVANGREYRGRMNGKQLELR
jgi:SAM-dependent methyltransferase